MGVRGRPSSHPRTCWWSKSRNNVLFIVIQGRKRRKKGGRQQEGKKRSKGVTIKMKPSREAGGLILLLLIHKSSCFSLSPLFLLGLLLAIIVYLEHVELITA